MVRAAEVDRTQPSVPEQTCARDHVTSRRCPGRRLSPAPTDKRAP